MTALATGRSAMVTSLKRYGRSTGLWLLLLAGPVGARFMVARDDGSGIQIAIDRHLPVMTSAMLGISLGIVVSTLLLPIGYLYLRSNVTRRQPWQVEEVTGASRLGIVLGRFVADTAILFAMLATLTLAGWVLGWLIVTGPLDVGRISYCLWLVAAPALMGLAAFRVLMDAAPITRRAIGDVLFFVAWLTSIAMPMAVAGEPSGFRSNIVDFAGFVRPLVGAAPSVNHDFSIGNTTGIRPGRIPLDVLTGIHAPGYLASRLAWALIALGMAAIAGLLYRPHTARRRSGDGFAARLLAAGPPPAVVRDTPPAALAAAPFAALVAGEFRLIAAGRLFHLLAIAAVAIGLFGDYRHIGSPAALLLLIFGFSAQAGRAEAKGLSALAHTAPLSAMARRLAFLLAGLGWSLLLAAPAALIRLSPQPLLLSAGVGTAAASIAIVLAAVSRAAFAPRLVLLVLWYGYLS